LAAPRIVLLGDINVDVSLVVDAYPARGGDGMSDRLDMHIGGGVTNTAIALSCLGVSAAPLVCTGQDAWADFLREQLARTAVDTSLICVCPGAGTGMIFVVVTPDGERTMFSYRGANRMFRLQDVVERSLENADWLHLSAYALLEPPQQDAVWRAVELAHSRNIPVSMDVNNDVVQRQPEQVRRILPHLHTCILGRSEIEWLGGAGGLSGGLDCLLQMGVSLIAVKLGGAGCILANTERRLSFPAFEVDAVDASGAGDAFSAGIVYACVKGMSLPAAAVLASALGALTASVHGAGLAIPGKADLLAFLENQPADLEGIREMVAMLNLEDGKGDRSLSNG
jgi:ribokinase